MATGNEKILTAEQEMELRRPIDDYVGGYSGQDQCPESGWNG